MQIRYINEMLNLPELTISQILFIGSDELHIEALPVDYKQNCPCCMSDQAVIRKGSNVIRRIRHLQVFDKKTYLCVPSIRMYCVNCGIGFVWAYDFVDPKQRHSHLFRFHAVKHALGATAAHSAKMHQTPVSSVQDMHNKSVPMLCEQLTGQAWEEA
ncbi:hypothetical protein [Paenibacillus pseudetheri]|uniref:Transposase IS204/IS1001/IS1096/IS1165 zinc-finger domain-containing protein n=1 Tax=Paenibacillus pseudetheri TaxID=2897682 RepID=A0ABN8FPD1_9BACL|nr:hypothetical protein [Paenibacillus pseudetheri]CAH1059814.1 hypothetical protein PAECIP111894_06026 [Paenibacillus pseudetheri]